MNDVTKDLLVRLRVLLSLHDARVDTADAWNLSMEEARSAIARAEAALAEEVRAYVQAVPDHCDRITWRGSYYNLPIPSKATAPQPDVGGWIPWVGTTKHPTDIPPNTAVEVKLRCGGTPEGLAYGFDWTINGTAGDIIAYRIVRK